MTGRTGLRPAARLGFESVVHVNEKGGRFGGTEEYIDLITPALAAMGVRSHLVCGRVVAAISASMESTTVIDGLASRATPIGTAMEVVAEIDRLDPDVVYLHNLFAPDIVAGLAASDSRAVIVWYVHDHYLTCLSELRWRRDQGACRERLGDGCLTAIDEGRCVMRNPSAVVTRVDLARRHELADTLSLVDHVVVISEYMRDLLIAARPDMADRIHCVARPIRDLGATQARTRETNDRAVITFAGRITPEKGLDVLIEALMVVRSDAPIDVCVAGVIEHPGHWEHCLDLRDRAMRRNPRLQITALGHLDYATTDELFRRSDIVAIPSQWPEPLGCVALEAMSAGAVVIASDIGGLGSTIDHGATGLLVSAGHAAGWTAAIEHVLRDPAGAGRMSAQAQLQARSHTTIRHLYDLDGITRQGKRDERSGSGRVHAPA